MILMILTAIATGVGAIALAVFAHTLLSEKRHYTSDTKKMKDLFPEVQQDTLLVKKVSELSVNFNLIKERVQESNKYTSQLEESQRNLQAQLNSLNETVDALSNEVGSLSDSTGVLGDEVFSLQAVNKSILDKRKTKSKSKKKNKRAYGK